MSKNDIYIHQNISKYLPPKKHPLQCQKMLINPENQTPTPSIHPIQNKTRPDKTIYLSPFPLRHPQDSAYNKRFNPSFPIASKYPPSRYSHSQLASRRNGSFPGLIHSRGSWTQSCLPPLFSTLSLLYSPHHLSLLYSSPLFSSLHLSPSLPYNAGAAAAAAAAAATAAAFCASPTSLIATIFACSSIDNALNAAVFASHS